MTIRKQAASLKRDGGLSCWFRAMHFDRKEGAVALFATTLGGGL